ncbi:MAG: PBP1A family penicillin-binding protein [Rhodospirillaceae bacterium]|nr:MAG: PBP1A family penicillin-binding protein [Rhodospirillaceae bacterium]
MAEGKRSTPKKPRKGASKAPTGEKSAKPDISVAKSSSSKSMATGKSSGLGRLTFCLFKWSLICAIWSGVALGGLVAWYAWDLPDISNLETPTRRTSITLTDSVGREIATYGDLYGEALRLADVPPYLVQAIVATEDRRFFDHGGFDPLALARAAVANVRAGRVRQGGSTLTQQLAKNIFLKPDRTLRRKVQELLLAFWLEANFSKEQIFTLYINRVYLGSGAYGVDAAARRYFGKSVKSITLHEAAVIAGLLKAPSRYSPLRSRTAAEKRARIVLKTMVAAKFLDDRTAKKIGSRRLRVVGRSGHRRTARYFTDWALDRVSGFVGRVESDLIVRTTMDSRLQTLAESRLRAVLKRDGAKRNIRQAALVSMSPTGAVRALVGGRDYASSQYNRAFQARRQPGSAFKLFVYLAALENGMHPQDQLIDGPLKIGKWQPRNYGGGYDGAVTLKDAMARSINTVAVQVSERIGRQKVIDIARRLGITSPLRSHPSLALGASEVSLVELTSAYGVIANGGVAVWPHAITEIRTRNGKILYHRREGATTQVVDPQAVRGVNDMLRAVVAGGTGRGANPGRPAAGKTGTSQDFRDAWFIGYTGDLVTGVWMGNDDSSPMKRVTGGGYPAQLWRAYTRAALKGRLVKPLPPPPSAAMSSESSSFLNWLKRNGETSAEDSEDPINSE